MNTIRWVLLALGLAFTGYLAARGMWWMEPVSSPVLVVVALGFYLITAWLCLFWEPGRRPGAAGRTGDSSLAAPRAPLRLPLSAAILAVLCAATVPTAVTIGVGMASIRQPDGTWYLGGIGALMTIVMVRRRPVFAWTGIVLLAAAALVWMGPVDALAYGLVGSVVWTGAAQLLLASLDRAAQDALQLAQLQSAASAWRASQAVRQRERRTQVQRALAVAGPILARVISSDGRLTDDERDQARLIEGAVRDEIRGPRLLNDRVRAALRGARTRGVEVTVLDDGGLQDLGDTGLDAIRARLAEIVSDAGSERLYVRTSPHDRIAVTVVGRSNAGERASDEDTVDLWEEIPHPDAAD